ncbi:MAG: DNA-protecting protein DprA [Desulfomonile sp.]|nr:DNA-protecting protein DprA [Desulfomonile sp.]
MEREHATSAMFTAALIASLPKLTSRERSLVASLVTPFDIANPSSSADGIAAAFQKADIELLSDSLFHPRRVKHARALAENWLQKGVIVVRGDRIRAGDAHVHDVPPILFGYGPEEFLDQEAAAVVNSRRPRRITPGDLWIDALKLFFHDAVGSKHAIVSSYGTLSYNLVSRLASRHGSSLLMVCDHVLPFMTSRENEARFLAEKEGLFRKDRTLFLSPFPPGSPPRPAERFIERDRVCLALSSRIFVGALRRGGTMKASLQRALLRPVRMTVLVEDGIARSSDGNSLLRTVPGKARVDRRLASTIPRGPAQSVIRVAPALSRLPLVLEQWPEQGAVLIHYTRSCPGPWPGQSISAYLDAILNGLPSAGHTGFDTLMRILAEGRIRASGKLTRGGRPVVSLTECRPGDIQQLARWRKGLIRWSFEPYGIAVDRQCLEQLGAQEVIYGDTDVYSGLPEEQRHLFQLNTASGPDWAAEKEWRLSGDLCLDSIPRNKLTVIVAELDEARVISERFRYRVTLAGSKLPG